MTCDSKNSPAGCEDQDQEGQGEQQLHVSLRTLDTAEVAADAGDVTGPRVGGRLSTATSRGGAETETG